MKKINALAIAAQQKVQAAKAFLMDTNGSDTTEKIGMVVVAVVIVGLLAMAVKTAMPGLFNTMISTAQEKPVWYFLMPGGEDLSRAAISPLWQSGEFSHLYRKNNLKRFLDIFIKLERSVGGVPLDKKQNTFFLERHKRQRSC